VSISYFRGVAELEYHKMYSNLTRMNYLGFEALIATIMDRVVFWDVAPCSLIQGFPTFFVSLPSNPNHFIVSSVYFQSSVFIS
jgi:hypothetical protein